MGWFFCGLFPKRRLLPGICRHPGGGGGVINEVTVLEELILSVVFVVCLVLIGRHIKRVFSPGSDCGSACSGCSSAAKKENCPSTTSNENDEARITRISVDSLLSSQHKRGH